MLLSAQLELFEPLRVLPHRAQLALLFLPFGKFKRTMCMCGMGKVPNGHRPKSGLRVTSLTLELVPVLALSNHAVSKGEGFRG